MQIDSQVMTSRRGDTSCKSHRGVPAGVAYTRGLRLTILYSKVVGIFEQKYSTNILHQSRPTVIMLLLRQIVQSVSSVTYILLFINLFSCIAVSLFNKHTYLLTYLLKFNFYYTE